MIRDGRDVASSILKMNWGPNTIEDVADRWRKIILDTRKYVGEPYYLELKYEDLINDVLHTLDKVCSFIGEKFDQKMLYLLP